MRTRPIDRRSPLFASTAWLCIALQLTVVFAAGWHAHGPGRCEDFGAPHTTHNSCCDAGGPADCEDSGEDCCDRLPGELADDDDGDSSTPARERHDPGGCSVCHAIFALQHAALTPVAAVALHHAEARTTPRGHEQTPTITVLGRPWSRGPPTTGS